jgi:long-chain acyl-CoA synthetase
VSDSVAVEDSVRTAARAHPGKPALIAGDTVLTWADLDAQVDLAAGRVAARTSAPGDRVALVMGTTIDFAVTYFGVLRAGRIAVPLNPAYTGDERGYALADSGVSLVVEEALADGPVAPLPAGIDPDRTAVLLYTSGTSGRPKGAMLSHRALAANHRQLDAIDPPVAGPDDVVLLAVPFFHAYGLNTGLGMVAHLGATGVLSASPADIAGRGVTVVIGVPSMYAAWARSPDAFAGVRTAVSGAAPLDPAVAARFTEVTGQPIIIGYGLTEAAPVLTTTAAGDRSKVNAIGRPLPGVELRLVTADGTELWRDGTATPEPDLEIADVPGTDPGEIVVRGPNLFSGYWPDGRDGPDADGWWATGDIAYADADGDLVLVDRIGELILVHGFNVYPAEIERVLADHPQVAEAAVVGVPDPVAGQTPHAYVVAAPGPAPTPDELRDYSATRLARFKLPSVIDIVAELPHSAIGKVRKGELR